MTIWLICYDLRNEQGSQDYEPLWDELKRLKCHRTQDSVWLGNFGQTAREIHDHFKKFVDGDDRLMVSEFTKLHMFSNAMGGTNDWLKQNPPTR